MKHPDTSCGCGQGATPLALRWRCPGCGRTAIMKLSTRGAVCDGVTIRKAEPEVLEDHGRSEERRVGKEWRSRGGRGDLKKKRKSGEGKKWSRRAIGRK